MMCVSVQMIYICFFLFFLCQIIKKQFTGILDSLNREKRDINQLYLTSVHTITELRKTDVLCSTNRSDSRPDQ